MKEDIHFENAMKQAYVRLCPIRIPLELSSAYASKLLTMTEELHELAL